MLEVTNVAIAGVTATAVSMFNYSYIKKIRNSTRSDLSDKKKKWQKAFAERELWEHAATASTQGITMFLIIVFAVATDTPHFSSWPRLAIASTCYTVLAFVLGLALHSLTQALFRYFMNR